MCETSGRQGTARPYRVAILAIGDAPSVMHIALVDEIWRDREPPGAPSTEVIVCGDGAPAAANGAPIGDPIGVRVELPLTELKVADVVVVPGGTPHQLIVPSSCVRGALVEAHRRGARIVGLGSGAFPVAAAGLLDGRAATTEATLLWRLRTAHPRVISAPFESSTSDDGVYTGAGLDGATDACLRVVEDDWGVLVATRIRRELYATPRFQKPPPRPITRTERDTDACLKRLVQWIPLHLDEDLSVPALAARVGMSAQPFANAFRDAVGATPNRWVNDLRVDRAARLLVDTTSDIGEVATSCGFGSAAALRYHMRRLLGVSPTDYRRSRQTEFPADDGSTPPSSSVTPPGASAWMSESANAPHRASRRR